MLEFIKWNLDFVGRFKVAGTVTLNLSGNLRQDGIE